MVLVVAGSDTLAVAGSGTSAVAGSDTSVGSATSAVWVFATSALPPASRLSVIFTDRYSFIGSTGRYSSVRFADMSLLVVHSSSVPPSMVTMLGVRGCATAHSSQGVHTGGGVTTGVSAGNLALPTRFVLNGEASNCAATAGATAIGE